MNIQNQLARALFFKNSPKYRAIVERAIAFSKTKQTKECQQELSYLPTDEKLLEKLMAKIAHKSVGTGVKKILEGKVTNKYEGAKVYSSLLTHILVECEQGNTEYLSLVGGTIERIQSLL
jgi:hypothetical protein